jgi:hypothetical protein
MQSTQSLGIGLVQVQDFGGFLSGFASNAHIDQPDRFFVQGANREALFLMKSFWKAAALVKKICCACAGAKFESGMRIKMSARP